MVVEVCYGIRIPQDGQIGLRGALQGCCAVKSGSMRELTPKVTAIFSIQWVAAMRFACFA
jgi:hypothetical protein